MPAHIELNPVTHLTVGTVGEPGNRTFYLQGSKGNELVSLIIEKQQAAALARSFQTFLDELGLRHEAPEEGQDPVYRDMRLREPLEALFRVGNMGLSYNEEADRIGLIAYELVEEGEEPNVVSYWATRRQIRSFIEHAIEVVKAGRPICGNCQRPIDAEGHFCPQRNGHVR